MNYLALLSGMFSVFIFGMGVALLGSIKLKLTPKLGIDDAQFGKIVSVLQFTMVIFAIVAGILLDSWGFQLIIIFGIILSALATLVIGFSASYGLVLVGAVLLGIGGQFVNNGGNVLVPSLFEDYATGSNFGNTFFGLGAFLFPLIAGILLEKMDIKKALTIIAVVMVIPVIFPLFAEFPVKEASFSGAVATSLLSNYITWIAALTLFCYIGLETSMAIWISSYAKNVGASDSQANNTLSLFFVFMMISRLILGISGMELAPIGGWVIMVFALIAAGAILWMMSANNLGTARIAVALAGFVFGPIFPTTVGTTFQHYDAATHGTLFGVIFAIGLLGATLLPAWIGSLAKGKTVKQSLGILVVTAVVLAVIGTSFEWAIPAGDAVVTPTVETTLPDVPVTE